MKNRFIFLCVVAGAIALACAVAPLMIARASGAQAQAARAQDPVQDPRFAQFVYDVASIKPHKDSSAMGVGGRGQTPDGDSQRNVPLSWLVSSAYYTERSQVSDTGMPGWLKSEHYDVEAKMDPAVADALQKLSRADQKLARRHMMQALLRDRLKLAVHVETKEIPIYELVVGKNGSKMKETTDPATPDGGFRYMGTGGGVVMTALDMPLSNMLGQLSYDSGRTVFDKTGLTGRYSFTLKYSPVSMLTAAAPGTDSAPLPDSAPPLAKALEEQLGLKLVPSRGPMDYIVIDHVERPSPN